MPESPLSLPAAVGLGAGHLNLSYLLPIYWREERDEAEMAAYLAGLSEVVEIVVVDGSPEGVFTRHRREWGSLCKHIRPHSHLHFLNGKVNGVLTGLREATHDNCVIADDDVRYGAGELEKMDKLLAFWELVLPQNYFEPLPWHAHWDTARTLLNRSFSHDYPGTLGVRRSFLLEAGGYNGDVLFENLELIRTVKAAGGTVVHVPDLFVRRLPPTARQFWSQRVRQAYDDLAQPWRLIPSLALLPAGAAAARRRTYLTLLPAGASMALAEIGRRRDGGESVFKSASSLFAPLWLLERAVCVWVALAQRILRGGCIYGDSVIPRAATPLRELRRGIRRRDVEGLIGERQIAGGVATEAEQLV